MKLSGRMDASVGAMAFRDQNIAASLKPFCRLVCEWLNWSFRDQNIAASLKQTKYIGASNTKGTFRDQNIAASLKLVPFGDNINKQVTHSAIKTSRPH